MTEQRQREHRLFDLIESAVDREGYELVAVELITVEGRFTLRVSIDRVGGVSVRDCSRISRALSPVLDVEEPIEGTWNLEVSSPGIDRPIQRASDFVRFEGYRARIQLSPGEGRRRFKGVLRGVEGEDVMMEVDGQRHALPLDRIERARLVLDLDEYQHLAEEPPPRPDTGIQ